jgi:hypothetical protein
MVSCLRRLGVGPVLQGRAVSHAYVYEEDGGGTRERDHWALELVVALELAAERARHHAWMVVELLPQLGSFSMERTDESSGDQHCILLFTNLLDVLRQPPPHQMPVSRQEPVPPEQREPFELVCNARMCALDVQDLRNAAQVVHMHMC